VRPPTAAPRSSKTDPGNLPWGQWEGLVTGYRREDRMGVASSTGAARDARRRAQAHPFLRLIALSPLDAAIACMRELRRSDSLSLVAPSVSPLLRRRRYVLFSHVFA
jgi:hypothetical protein